MVSQRLAATPISRHVLVAIGARVEVPMVPVPMTLQSLFVVSAGGILGPTWGFLAMVLYLAGGA